VLYLASGLALLAAALPVILIAADSSGERPRVDSILQGSFPPRGKQQLPPANPGARIVSWNVNKGRNPGALAEALRGLDCDVCLLQEIDFNARRTGNVNVTEQIAHRLGMNWVFAPAFEELGQTGGAEAAPAFMGQSTVTRLRVRGTHVVRFHTQSSFWKPRPLVPNWPLMQRRQGGRNALAVELESPAGALVAYNLHLESRGNATIRRAQLNEVLEDARRYGDSTTVVIAGDLNSKFDPTAVLRYMETQGYRNSYGTERQRTHKLVGSVDWIFVRGRVGLEAGEVHREIGLSDHYPLSVRVVKQATAGRTIGERRPNPK
jgi:endonuclease/exonuclease/phosphatase family metal-dependent hydrolase